MTTADPEIRDELSRAAEEVSFDVAAGLETVHRMSDVRRRVRRSAVVVIGVGIAVGALMIAALLLPLQRERRPGTADPRGGRIAYTQVTLTGDTLDWDVYVAAADGSNATALVTGAEAALAPAWSPDGDVLAFVSGTVEASEPELWLVNADGSGARPIVRAPQIVADSAPAWSPDGERIAFIASERRGSAVWSVRPDGTDARRILEGSWRQLSWSPDGTRLVLIGFRGKAGDPGLFVVRANGVGLVRLASFEDLVAFPTWSPDGTRIAFMALDPADQGLDYAYDVFAMNADGTGLTRVTTWEGFDGFPTWSPDGERILFSSDRGASEEQLRRNRAGEGWFGASLYVMRPDGSELRLVLEAGEATLLPTSWVA
ncbi:MAG: hypothetical protein ACRDKA_03540 [Actinomycetota bacterium]